MHGLSDDRYLTKVNLNWCGGLAVSRQNMSQTHNILVCILSQLHRSYPMSTLDLWTSKRLQSYTLQLPLETLSSSV